MPIPRIITVDPTWTIARVVRSALDLLDRSATQVDVPGSAEALGELSRGCTLLITNYDVDDSMRGFELAMRVKRESPDTAVIVLGDTADPDEFDPETAAESPYAYLSRPMDIQKFLRVLSAGLEGTSLHEAMHPTALAAPVINHDMGSVPMIDINAAQSIIDTLRVDLGALAILLASRTGDVLLERGAVGLINREKLATTMLPAVLTNIEAKDMLGGQLSSVQFYDGEEYDVFVLTVGLHHFMCAIFDGRDGSRQFGAVNRFGRRAVEDLIALIGASAFFVQPKKAAVNEDELRHNRKKAPKIRETDEVELIPLARADLGSVAAEPVIETFKLDPIENFNPDDLFGSSPDLDADALFDLDDLEELVNKNIQNAKGKLDWNGAKTIGIIPD